MGILDPNLEILEHLVGVVDQQIARLQTEAGVSPGPEGFGIRDRLDGLVGLGFVACQQ